MGRGRLLTWLLAAVIGCSALAADAAPPRKHHRPARPAKAAAPAEAPAYAGRPEIQAFAEETASLHPQLRAEAIVESLAAARYQASVTRFIMPAATPSAKNWAAYRARFIDARRIGGGLAFWRANERWLREAEARWGLPPAIVVAIIGIETLYGQHTGTYRAIDALSTLSFDFPSGRSDRSAFFRRELQSLLLLAQREGIDPASLRSSYAGAMGLPQFMPLTWLRYAVDFDGDGRTDLHGDPADVIGSVARYLAAEGWQRGMPTHFAVEPPDDTEQRARLLVPDILPTFTPAEMAAHGARLATTALQHGGPLALVELRNGENPPSFVAGTENFYAITRYNWSAYYAMAVIDLAQALQQAFAAGK